MLMVAYEFPPLAAGGVMRTVKFAKYLVRAGVSVHVLAPRNPAAVDRDASLLDDLDGVHVHRTHSFELRDTGWGWMDWRIRRIWQPLAFPDAKALWAVPSIPKAVKLVRRFGLDAIYTTSWPYSSHLVGMAVQRYAGAPWVADFRDPWTRHHNYGPTSGRRHERIVRLESAVCRKADRVLTTTDSATESFRADHSDVDAAKFVTIRNGFDEDDFVGEASSSDDFLIVHAGSLYGTRSPVSFFRALGDFLERRPEARDCTSVRMLGAWNDRDRDCVIPECVRFEPWVSHADAVMWMRRASVLLLVQHRDQAVGLTVPGKLYEYMASRRHILGVSVHRGENERLLKGYGNSTVLHDGPTEAVTDALCSMFDRHTAGESLGEVNDSYVRGFTRAVGAAALIRQLHEVVAGSAELVSSAEIVNGEARCAY